MSVASINHIKFKKHGDDLVKNIMLTLRVTYCAFTIVILFHYYGIFKGLCSSVKVIYGHLFF